MDVASSSDVRARRIIRATPFACRKCKSKAPPRVSRAAVTGLHGPWAFFFNWDRRGDALGRTRVPAKKQPRVWVDSPLFESSLNLLFFLLCQERMPAPFF